MVFKYFQNIKDPEKGITLIEITVVLFIIALFFTIVIIGLPEIERRFALSRSTYKLAQELRKARDLSISGVKVKDSGGNEIMPSGYGVYADMTRLPNGTKEYVIYADLSGGQEYNNGSTYVRCDEESAITFDCVVDIIDLGKENRSIFIKTINTAGIDPNNGSTVYGSTDTVSINFLPPNPDIKMTSNTGELFDSVEIVLSTIGGSDERTVFVNKAGLINIK